MRKHVIPFVVCSLSIPVSIYSQISQHPNIIMFLVDDMGWQDTSVPFYNDELTPLNKRFHTPNIKQLSIFSLNS